MRLRVLSAFICVFAIFQAFGAADALYFVGGFNNWDISHPTVAYPDEDGVYTADVDFSNNREFKMSTVDPKGDWNIFDTGTLYPLSDTKENEWIPIEERAKSANVKAPAKQEMAVKVDLANMRMMFSTAGGNGEAWSGTLPVMFITTEGKAPVTSKEDYLKATYWLDPMGVDGIEAVGSVAEPQTMQIRGRGNYTWWGFDKKPYRIKLDKKTPLLGMDKSKHFALLAHADDSAAGLRNALGFAASEELGMPWTPSTQPLEVVLNGDYIGLYWLTETVRVDKDRVDVVEQADDADEDVDGGWLVEIDNYDTDPHVTVRSSSGQPIWFTYKSPESLSTAQESYLQTAMQSIQDALASGDVEEASRLVDFDVLARYFIANQLMLDMESFHGSCYLNRQRGETEKWMFGPVWDFGNAFSQGRGDNPRFIFDRPEFSQHWIGEFYAMPRFVEAVKKVWSEFLNGGPSRIEEILGDSAGEIAAAAVNDARRWPQYAHKDVAAQASRLKSWLGNSVEWLKKQWGAETAVEALETEGTVTVYGIDGRRIKSNVKGGIDELGLSPGVYIVGGRKVMVR